MANMDTECHFALPEDSDLDFGVKPTTDLNKDHPGQAAQKPQEDMASGCPQAQQLMTTQGPPPYMDENRDSRDKPGDGYQGLDDVETQKNDVIYKTFPDDDDAVIIPVYLFNGPSTPELPHPDDALIGEAATRPAAPKEKPPRKTKPVELKRGRTLRLSKKQKEAVKRHAKHASKKLVLFLVSHVGLTCLVVAYAILGGFIFQRLESEEEQIHRGQIYELRQEFIKELWYHTEHLNIFEPERWEAIADDLLQKFQQNLSEATRGYAWDGTDNVTSEAKWTYAGSLLYSVTVITTIGYGNLTPETTEGKVVTMLYALVGIPMTLLCLTNIGSLMANCFRILWANFICKPCRDRLKHRTKLQAAKQKAAAAAYLVRAAKEKRAAHADLSNGDRIGIRCDEGLQALSQSPGVLLDGTQMEDTDITEKRLSHWSLNKAEEGQCSPCFEGVPSEMSASGANGNLGSAKTPKSECSSTSANTQVFRYQEPFLDDKNRGNEEKTRLSPFSTKTNVFQFPEKGNFEKMSEEAGTQGSELKSAFIRHPSATTPTTPGTRQSWGDQSTPASEAPLSPTFPGTFQSLVYRAQAKGSKNEHLSGPEISVTDETGPRSATYEHQEQDNKPVENCLINKSDSTGEQAVADAVCLLQEGKKAPEDAELVAAEDAQLVADLETSLLANEQAKKVPKEVVRVPIMVCLALGSAYIILGAVCFSQWEGWDFFESSYFCFVTLSTIGFGDLVPGYDNNTWNNTANRVTCALYLLFGLALVAMCFELIQVELRHQFIAFAQSLGFYVDDED